MTPKLTVTAKLSAPATSKDAELHALRALVDAATHQARGAGGHKLSGEVSAAFNAGNAQWKYQPGE